MRWSLELSGYGYELLAPGREPASAGEFVLRARRPTHYGGPPAMIDVRELWVPGADPGGLGLEQHGCHLEVGGWHAQLRAGEEIGAMRLDVDRRKKPELVVHEHPFGRPNHVRVPAAPLVSPERWIHEVEVVIADLHAVDDMD